MVTKKLIYGLRDPRTFEIRYVGQSSAGLKRPRGHKNPSVIKNGNRIPLYRWVSVLQKLGLSYEIVVLEALTYDVADEKEWLNNAERRWICVGRTALGRRFLNCTDGGEGVVGYKWSPELRAKFAAAERTPEGQERQRKRVELAHSPEARARSSASHRALAQTSKRKEHLAKARLKSHEPDVQERRTASLRTFYRTPEGRAKLEKSLEKCHTVQACQKISLSKQQRVSTVEGRAQILAASKKAHESPALEKLSKARKAWLASPAGLVFIEKTRSPEVRQKLRKASNVHWSIPGARQRHAEIMKEYYKRRKEQNNV